MSGNYAPDGGFGYLFCGMSGGYPPVGTSRCQFCGFDGMGNTHLNGLFSIQNGRIIYQGPPPVGSSNFSIEDLNKAFHVIIQALSVFTESRMISNGSIKTPEQRVQDKAREGISETFRTG